MRWIVRSSLKVPLPAGCDGGDSCSSAWPSSSTRRLTSSPSSLPARRDPDPRGRVDGVGRWKADHRPAGAGAQRAAAPRHHAVEVGSQLSSIEMIFKLGTDLLQDRQLVQERLASVVPTLPTWAAPPVMMPPVSATSRIMKIGMTSKTQSLSTCRWPPTGRSGSDCSGARRRQRRHLGRALKMPRCRSRPTRWRGTRLPRQRHGGDGRRPRCRHPEVRLRGSHRHRWFRGDRWAAHGRHHILPIKTPEDLAQVRWPSGCKTIRIGTWRRCRASPAGSRRRHQRGPGLMLVVEKFPWGKHVQMTRGSKSASMSCGPACLASR